MAAGPCDTACGVEACLLSTTAPLLNCFWQSLRRAAAKSIGASQLRLGLRGFAMNKDNEYRENAAECERRAHLIRDKTDKRTWLDMAQHWRQSAFRPEGATTGIDGGHRARGLAGQRVKQADSH